MWKEDNGLGDHLFREEAKRREARKRVRNGSARGQWRRLVTFEVTLEGLPCTRCRKGSGHLPRNTDGIP